MSQSSNLSFVPRPTDFGQMKDDTPDDYPGIRLVGQDGRTIQVTGDQVKRATVVYTPLGTPPYVVQGNMLNDQFRNRIAGRIAGPQQDVRQGVNADLDQAARTLKQKLSDGGAAESADPSGVVSLSRAVYASYKQLGQFYRSYDGKRILWICKATKYLHELRIKGNEDAFRHLLFQSHGLIPSDHRTANVISGLRSIAYSKAKAVEVHEVATLHNDAFYVYTNDGYMLRVRVGEEKPIRTANGANGVLFLHQEGLPALEVAKKVRMGAIEELIGKLARVLDQPGFSAQAQLYLLKCWLIAALVTPPGRTRPMVAFLGPPGSGKTKGAAATLLTLIYGRERGSVGLAAGQRDIETTLVSWPFACIDNLDGPVKPWLLNLLASAASGQEVSRRELYTDDGLYHRTPRCNLILTSMRPQFCRGDLAQRTLPLYLKPFGRTKSRLSEVEIGKLVQDARPECWAEIFSLVGKALALRQKGLNFQTNIRLADFAGWVFAIASAEGREDKVEQLLLGLERQQLRFATTSDPLVGAILGALAEDSEALVRLRASELLEELQLVEPELESWSPERLAKRLKDSDDALAWGGIEVVKELDRHVKAYLYTIRQSDQD